MASIASCISAFWTSSICEGYTEAPKEETSAYGDDSLVIRDDLAYLLVDNFGILSSSGFVLILQPTDVDLGFKLSMCPQYTRTKPE
jgi:hypothetical protein